MVNVKLNRTDSKLFNFNVVDWKIENKITLTTFNQIEANAINLHNPKMITAFLPVHLIDTISLFTNNNYQFIECRIFIEKHLINSYNTSNLYPYEFVQVSSRKQLSELIDACSFMTFDDRFTNDPDINKKDALNRNIYFLEQSFKRKNEYIFINVV